MKLAPLLGLLAIGLSACNKSEPSGSGTVENESADPHAGLTNYDVDRVADLLTKQAVIPVDANSADTRQEYGTLPGAVLLSSSEEFKLAELPADKSKELVFYCGGEKCTSAPKAAKRAAAAGYENVRVMRAGIKGWAKAGKTVDKQS